MNLAKLHHCYSALFTSVCVLLTTGNPFGGMATGRMHSAQNASAYWPSLEIIFFFKHIVARGKGACAASRVYSVYN